MNHPAPLDLATLNARFAIPERLRFMDSGPGLPMADMASGGYQRMVCVETVNAAPEVIRVAPGQQHAMGVVIGVAH